MKNHASPCVAAVLAVLLMCPGAPAQSGTQDRLQLRCHWLDGGDGKLAELPSAPGGLAWSPDGRNIAFFMFVAEKSKPFFQLPVAPDGAKWADPPKVIRSTAFRADGEGY